MSQVQNIRMLARYAAWANDRLYEALAELPERELTKPHPIVFGSILRTLNHVYVMDLVWRAHLEGTPLSLTTRNPEECPPFAELRAAQKDIDRWYIRCSDQLQENSCDEIVNFSFIGGGNGSMSRAEIVLHVVNHTTYHRGHVACMIFQVPAEPPTTDLPVYLRERAKDSNAMAARYR
jgi:uncharacterized damage-inducible protein DinB